MNCLDEGLIQAYIDNELSEHQIPEVDRHLETCSKCKYHYLVLKEQKKHVLEAINHLVQPSVVPEFAYMEQAKMGVKKRLSSWVSVSAACLFLILLFTTYQPKKTEIQDVFLYPSLGDQVDANLPLTQQDFTITIVEGSAINAD